MKSFKKIISALLSMVMLGSTVLFNLPQDKNVTAQTPTMVETAQTNAVNAKKYSVSITQSIGGPTFFCNNTALTQGDSMTLTYTVQAKGNLSVNDSSARSAGVFSKPTQAKAYPQIGLATNEVTDFDNFKINGTELNPTNAPTLPDLHFGVGSTYQMSFVPQSGNATYDWTLKKDGTPIDGGSVAYSAYMGIMIYHFHTYRLTLAEVSITTATTDLGVYAHNEGSPKHNAQVVNANTLPMITLNQDNIEAVGSTATVENSNGYFASNSIKLTEGNPKIYLYLDGLEQYKTTARVHVSLRLYLEITTDSATRTTWYSPIELKTESGLYIDGDMPRNTWNNINYDAVVMERNGRKCVQLSVTANAGEVMYISAAQVLADQTETKYTLGGCEIYQMEIAANLGQSYVIVSPSGEVVVIDGGDVAEAPALYHFITQFTHKIDHWFISHYHEDHCMALVTMLQSGAYDFVIENLHYNFPTQEQCQTAFDYIISNSPTAADETPSMVSRKNVLDAPNPKVLNRVTSTMGQVFDLGGGSRIKVISSPDFAPNMNYGNNTSLMYKLETENENVLFLNDIGDTGDEYITENPTINYGAVPSATFREEIADCAYVQLGHHGQNGPSLNFYNYCTDMRICLYAAKAWVMNNDNSNGVNSADNLVTLATRDFMREKGVYKYYSQENGRVKLV